VTPVATPNAVSRSDQRSSRPIEREPVTAPPVTRSSAGAMANTRSRTWSRSSGVNTLLIVPG
jgi:hypothetical protein